MSVNSGLITGKHSIGREFQSLTMRGRKLLTLISLEKKEVEPIEPVRINIYQSNTYRKDFKRGSREEAKGSREVASEGPTVLHIRFCSLSNNSK